MLQHVDNPTTPLRRVRDLNMGPCAFTRQQNLQNFEPLDYYDAPSYLKPPCKLRELPNELLAAIASHLRNKDLCNLALVSKQLRVVAQDTIIKPVRLPRNSIRKLLETLIDRPDLAQRIRHVDLGDFRYDKFGGSSEGPGDFDANTYQRYESLITKQFGSELWEEISRTTEGDTWNGRSYYLALLALMLPNMKQIDFEMRAIADPPQILALMPTQTQLAVQALQPPFCGTVMRLLAEKLERLTIADQSPKKGPHMHNLDLAQLTNLKRLSMPMATIVRKNSMISNLDKVLPLNLEYLELRQCNKFVFDLITSLSVPSFGPITLQKVGLFFKSSTSAAVLLAGDGTIERIGTLRKNLRELSNKGVRLTTFVQPYPWSRFWRDVYLKGNFQQEVDLTTILSPEEIYMACTKNVTFAFFAARDASGAHRKRTKFERRLIAKFWYMPIRLFTSPTFDAEKWSGIRMFNGTKGTGKHRNDKHVSSQAMPQKDAYGKPRKEKGTVNMSDCISIFKKDKGIHHIWPTSSTFDSVAWCKVKFFEEKNGEVEDRPVFIKAKPMVPESPRRRKSLSKIDDKTDEVIELARAWKI